jgi:hypothetical protein
MTNAGNHAPCDGQPMESQAVQRLVQRVRARRTQRALWSGAAVGLGAAALWELRWLVQVPLTIAPLTWHDWLPVALLSAVLLTLFGVLAAWWWQARDAHASARAARVIEQRVPQSHNLLFTAWELGARPSHEQTVVQQAVLARAQALAAQQHPSQLVSLRAAHRQVAAAMAGWLLALTLAHAATSGAGARVVRRVAAAATGTTSITRVDVRVAPPRYARTAASAERDPVRVQALEGSVLTFTVATPADTLHVYTASGDTTLVRPPSGDFEWRTTLDADGFVAFEARAPSRPPSARRLVGLTMQRDASPTVRIVAPARDLVVTDANRTLDVRVEAGDDVGLTTLQLHYTKVSGAGERFTFSEGTIPVQLARRSSTQWSARAALALAPLLTEPGDLVVYRARAADARPGAVPVESDAFIAELATPGGVAAFGFSMDPDEDRYAVSQQMVIQKTEKLIATRSRTAPAAVSEQAQQLAAEQRRVRAEFVFMTGGEFEQAMVADENGGADLDETHEAESEADLAAGRMVNRGRAALLTAIRAMSRAALSLGDADLTTALRYEKVALTNLQEAFARQRFLMRALSQREQLDLSRRLTGRLDSIARRVSPMPTGERAIDVAALRPVLDTLLSLGDGGAAAANADTRLPLLAERVLRVDAGSTVAQRIAQWLASAASRGSASPAGRVLLDSATVAMTTWMQQAARPVRATTTSPHARLQQRALTTPVVPANGRRP